MVTHSLHDLAAMKSGELDQEHQGHQETSYLNVALFPGNKQPFGELIARLQGSKPHLKLAGIQGLLRKLSL